MQYLRSKLFDLFAVIWTLLLSPSFPILWVLRTPQHYLRRVALIWVEGLSFGLWYIVGLKYVERGRVNIPDQPCIIVANHQSPWETIVFASLFPGAAFVAKAEMVRIPVVGWFLKNYPMIMIERGAGAKAIRQLITESRSALAEGRSIIIFPEGTRTSVSDPVVFKKGVELMYSELKIPVLPVALNSGVFWGPDRSFKYSGTITVSILPVIEPGLSRREFSTQAESILQKEKEKLIIELDIAPWIEALG
jgi:1-acyl-sn-glycerol-3-phosphate acyltransferase